MICVIFIGNQRSDLKYRGLVPSGPDFKLTFSIPHYFTNAGEIVY